VSSKQTIECPRCKGRVGLVFKGQTLEEALERHEQLTHGPYVLRPAPRPVAEVKVLKRRVAK
jgi:hypothetical protein